MFKNSKVDFTWFYLYADDETKPLEDTRSKVIHHVRESTWDNPELDHLILRLEQAEDFPKLHFLLRELEDLASWDRVWINWDRKSYNENL